MAMLAVLAIQNAAPDTQATGDLDNRGPCRSSGSPHPPGVHQETDAGLLGHEHLRGSHYGVYRGIRFNWPPSAEHVLVEPKMACA